MGSNTSNQSLSFIHLSPFSPCSLANDLMYSQCFSYHLHTNYLKICICPTDTHIHMLDISSYKLHHTNIAPLPEFTLSVDGITKTYGNYLLYSLVSWQFIFCEYFFKCPFTPFTSMPLTSHHYSVASEWFSLLPDLSFSNSFFSLFSKSDYIAPCNLGDGGSSLAQKAMTWYYLPFSTLPSSLLPILPSILPSIFIDLLCADHYLRH